MQSVIFQSLGGLGMFLFGMKIMSEGLQKVAGKKMRQVLSMVSNNRFIGCGAGALVTSIVQSSSATTVMLVSFVDAGLMTFVQAIGVILGANIGTTVTAQLIAFKITAYALPAIAAGVLLKFFLGRGKRVYVGDVLLGFGLVFFGLATMKGGFAPLKESETFISFFTKFNADNYLNILLCVLAGTILTMVLQSSSATVGITMVLATQGLLDFPTSVAVILGDNIGTTITAELASVGASINAHRTARAHTLFNVLGVFNIILFFPLFLKLVVWLTSTTLGIGPPDLIVGEEKPDIARHIANSHTLFNVVNALFFLMILPYLVKVAIWLTPHKKGEAELEELHKIKYMDSGFIDTPTVAIEQAKAEIIRMGESVQLMYDDVINSLEPRKLKKLAKWRKREDAIDILQKEITKFLIQVGQKNIMHEESREISSLLRMTNNLERVGDSIENVAELIEELIEQNLTLSEGGMNDYKEISKGVRKFIDFTIDSMKQKDINLMDKALALEADINRMREEMRGNYMVRLHSGVCAVDPGLILIDMLTAFEKMGDYCFNIAQAVAKVK
ncbi:MAG: Na/Pi cotransporter family protein [Deltaproteobacteria bacterium]|nr:Na/Pi cotransporter family protein [Deltaproteobacteria bacterium]